YRTRRGIAGPLFLGADTHALSEPALTTALEVLAANDVRVVVSGGGVTDAIAGSYGSRPAPVPTPVISHAILTHNVGAQYREWTALTQGGSVEAGGRAFDVADGIVATP